MASEEDKGELKHILKIQSPTPSNVSSASTLVGAPISAFSSARHRQTYNRLDSGPLADENPSIAEDDGEDIADTIRRGSGSEGLRIATASPQSSEQVAPLLATQASTVYGRGGKSNFVSPKMESTLSSGTATEPSGVDFSPFPREQTAYDPGIPYAARGDFNPYKQSASSIQDEGERYTHQSDTERLNKAQSYVAASFRSTKSAYETNDFQPHACPTRESFYHGPCNWLALSILCLAIFSTIFSGIFLGIALKAPRWGKTVIRGGAMSPSTANVLVQIFAKMIELSFVTVFVTFLGQVLSRRAFSRNSRGVTIAEITMRNWIMQPGSMITHYETVRFAAFSFLGMLSLAVAVFAMLYSTAASALVAPSLKFGNWDNKLMYGQVKSSFANVKYLQDTCPTPIQRNESDEDRKSAIVGNTCLQIEHAAQGYHNYQKYMTFWADVTANGNGTTDQKYRTPGFALFKENFTVNASWINAADTKKISEGYGRPVNNVTLAMPHTAVVKAAQDGKNGIVQPNDLDGIGVFNLRAQIPSPYLNVICANAAADEIKDLVYANMTGVTLNATRDFQELSSYWYTYFDWTNFTNIKSTPLDDIFDWKKATDRPAFYKFPLNFNTILNRTRREYSIRDSIYLLGKGAPDVANYTICKMKAGLTSVCSTEFTATGSGGNLASHCEDDTDAMQYSRSSSGRVQTTNLDWFDVASEALDSMSLNVGATDGAAANARLLMQLALHQMDLDAALPSPAEALAVMAGCTLLMSAEDSPFVEFWNYTSVILDSPQQQAFQAMIRAQEFASGGTQAYQRGFHIILFAVFLLNVFVLIYLLVNKGLVTDFSEPPNLFSLAVNSPPSHLLAGSCGGGPHGEQFKVNWAIETEGRHLFMTNKRSTKNMNYEPIAATHGDDVELTPQTTYTIPSAPNTPGPQKVGRSGSKFGRAYSMLSKRRSML